MKNRPITDERTQKRDRTASMICAAAAAAALLLFSVLGNLTPSYEALSARYVCFYPGRPSYSDPSGTLCTCEAALAADGTLYVPLETAVTALGGDISESGISLNGVTEAAASLEMRDGSVSLDSLCGHFGLSYRNYGDMIQIGSLVPFIPSEKRNALRKEAGCSEEDMVSFEQTEAEDVIDPYVKITHEVLLEDVAALERAYPDLVTSFTIGTTLEGREIPAFTFGRGERVIYYGAAIHASEYVTTNVLLEMVDRYAAGYRSGVTEDGFIPYRDLLDSITFYVIPTINPDGVNIVQRGFSACTVNAKKYDKQGAKGAYQYKANANGVDLNRNFPYRWTPQNYNQIGHRAWRYFCGFEANSEPEVQAMVTMAANIPFEMFADFHKFGEEFFWVDTDSTDHIDRYGYIARRLADGTGYALHEVEDISDFGGMCSNYMRNVYDRFSLTVEVCEFWNYNPPNFNKINKTVWKTGLIMGEELLKLEDEVEGLRITVNGRTVPCWEDCLMSDYGISVYQARKLVEACGGTLTADENGITAVIKEKTVSCSWEPSGSADAGDVIVKNSDGREADLTKLLSLTGAGAFLDGKTVRVYDLSTLQGNLK